jgi:hypothetical protein
MPTNRFQFSDDIVLKNGNVGINSADPQATLDVRGTIKADNLTVSGVATFTAYEGFLRTDYNIDESISITDGSALSGEIIVGTGVTVTNNATDYAGQGQIESLKVYNTFTPPVGGTEERPTKAKPGQLYYNQDFKTIEFFDGNNWRQVDNTTQRGRGVFGGGNINPFSTSLVDYVNISSLGNALNFGDLTESRRWVASCSSVTRGLWGAGQTPATPGGVVTIDYVTIASEGNAQDFGDLFSGGYGVSACSSSTRALFGGGNTISPRINIIDYVEISTIGNALDFGDLNSSRRYPATCSSTTRGFWAGGNPGGFGNAEISVVIISSKGDSTIFGDLTHARNGFDGCSNSTRGIFSSGNNSSPLSSGQSNVIDYITLSTNGDAVDFGDATTSKAQISSVSSSSRGLFGGGASPTQINIIDYVTISTTGNAQDFGDLTQPKGTQGACSDSHGGLGGF